MISLIVVDDEVLVRVGLKTMLPWSSMGYRIVGNAENGREGLALIRELQPDLVITDIKMPVMDGLEMMRRARDAGVKSRFIVLSSYDDFPLVREAMKMGAEDYLIKLELDQPGLTRVLNAAQERIRADAEQDRQKRIDDIRAHEGREAARKDLCQRLISGASIPPQEISLTAEYLGMDTGEQGLACCLVRVEEIVQDEKYARDDDRAVFDQQVEHLVNEVAGDSFRAFTFKVSEGFALLAFFTRESPRADRIAGLEKLGARICATLRSYMNITAAVGVSDIHVGLADLHSAFTEACAAADRSFFLGTGRAILFGDAVTPRTGEDLHAVDRLRELQAALDYSDSERLAACFDGIVKAFQGEACTREQLYDFCFQLSCKLREVLESRKDLPPGTIPSAGSYKDISSKTTLQALLDWIGVVKEETLRLLDRRREQGRNAAVIQKVKRYVQDNLGAEVRLADAAEFLHVNHCHLSTIFKQSTGECFSDYVTRVKMEEAQKLLSSSRYMVREVADKLGFTDAYYFSKVFKKVTTLTPTQFVQKKRIPGQTNDMPDAGGKSGPPGIGDHSQK